MIGIYKKHLTFYLALLISGLCLSQSSVEEDHKKPPRNQIALRHDNDFLMFSDRYYTSGLFLSYRRELKKGIFSKGKEQLLFSLIQEIYTPSDKHTEALRKLDRPFVGFHGLNFGWSFLNNNSALAAELLLGVAGEASGAGSFQRWYHESIVEVRTPSWIAEMESSLHANIYAEYIYEWQLSPNPFSIYVIFHPQAAFGTRDIYFQPGIIAHFGKRNALTSSIAYNSLGTNKNEVFCSLIAGYRFVGHNAFLEGNLAGDNSPFVVDPNSTVFYGGIDINHRSGNNDYRLGYRMNGPETRKMEMHKYIMLSYARSF